MIVNVRIRCKRDHTELLQGALQLRWGSKTCCQEKLVESPFTEDREIDLAHRWGVFF